MRIGLTRALLIAAASLWLAGCNTTTDPSSSLDLNSPGANANASADPDSTGSISPPRAGATAEPGLPSSEPADDVSLGKQEYRANKFGLAESHFRRATELHPRDSQAWLGLAACYDRLHRFDLADRAYAQAIAIVGETSEVLNNQGYSYILRGDYKHAREKLAAAKRKDPRNKYVLNNLALLAESSHKAKRLE